MMDTWRPGEPEYQGNKIHTDTDYISASPYTRVTRLVFLYLHTFMGPSIDMLVIQKVLETLLFVKGKGEGIFP